MYIQSGRFASLVVVFFLVNLPIKANAAVTYIPTSTTNTVGAASGLLDWNDGNDIGSVDGSIANDGLWRFRSTQGGDNGTWEATGSSSLAEDAVEIKTTATGLSNGNYDVYVFYRSDVGSNNWKIRAGLSSNPNLNTVYDRTGTDGIAGSLALSGASQLTFNGTAPTEDAQQNLLYAIIGQMNVTNGTLSVFVDDFPASTTGSANDRSWYDGIGYDIFVPPVTVQSVMSGLASSASTWSNNMPPIETNDYQVVASHTVTVNADFPGKTLEVQSGGAVDISADAANFLNLTIRAGGNLTESVSGDFALGDIGAQFFGLLTLEQDLTFNMDAGSDFFLDMQLDGPGNLNFNSNGPGSDLYLSAAGGHDGIIRFNGTGSSVQLTEADDFNVLEMNSTGDNKVVFAGTAASGGGTLIFNQSGVIDHAATQVAPPSTAPRLQSVNELEVNGDVTVDLSTTFPGNERRFLVSRDLRGTGDITINGTPTDPTGGSITHNEFELGSTGQPTTATISEFSGTITANNFVDIEIRNNLPNARIVIDNNARLEMGWGAIDPNQNLILGEVQVNSGGALEVGYEDNDDHNVGKLQLTSSGSRAGSLTLASGSTTIMQVNGTAANEFDSIVAEGDVTLAGTLQILVNPDGSGGTNPIYAPTLGDTFDIVSAVASSLPTDFDHSFTVDGGDLTMWQSAYGVDATADADGDGDSDGADFLAWQRSFGDTSAPAGTITGTFALSVVDPGNVMSGAGLAFQINYTSTLVQLEVVAGPLTTLAAVPEPSSVVLVLIALVGLGVRRNH
ncbi:PEP-CTERM sorting domain-containing protein [Bythopirellula polymerisocia]|uniref:PEP-CTERM protein-sorting domain-containing protein n=1 Tax=Bythopirellula polymerisocia TaxID=2528003 RepID=A0A5C6CX40_9BACT|nr:PEP-CTERM sorting domain-containing protein [Bythopirellula polymerisocia]TWU27586.1 hypothetical protein Pla144_23630 [Bythopirellula polymerisocia]